MNWANKDMFTQQIVSTVHNPHQTVREGKGTDTYWKCEVYQILHWTLHLCCAIKILNQPHKVGATIPVLEMRYTEFGSNNYD